VVNRRTELHNERVEYAGEINISPILMRMNSVMRNGNAGATRDTHTLAMSVNFEEHRR